MKKFFVVFLLGICGVALWAQPGNSAENLRQLQNRADQFYASGKYGEALSGYMKGMSGIGQTSTDYSKSFFRYMAFMAQRCYGQLNRPQERYELIESLLENPIFKIERDSLLSDYAESCLDWSRAIFNQGTKNYLQSRQVAGKGLPYAQGGVKIGIWKQLGYTYLVDGLYHEMAIQNKHALSAYKEAKKYFLLSGTERRAVVAMRSMAEMYKFFCMPDSAFVNIEEALQLARKQKMEADELELLEVKREICRNFEKWDDLLVLSDQIDSLTLSSSDDNVRVEGFRYMADEAMAYGDFERAEILYLRLLDMLDGMEKDKRQKSNKFIVLTKLRELSSNQKQYDKAIDYAKRAMNQGLVLHDGVRKDFGIEYALIGNLYADKKDRENCFLYMDSLFTVGGKGNTAFIQSAKYKLRGIAHKNLDELDEAIQDFLTAENLLYKVDADVRNELYSIYGLLGGTYMKQGKFGESLAYCEKYRNLVKDLYGTSSEEYARSLANEAAVMTFAGQVDGAVSNYMEAADIITAKTREAMRMTPSVGRDVHCRGLIDLLSEMTRLGCLSERRQDEFTERSYNLLMLTKGMLLASEKNAEKTIREHGSQADKQLYKEVIALRSHIKQLEAAPQKDSVQIISLYHQLLDKDVKLTKQCAAYGDITKFADLRGNDVVAALTDHEVVVDFIDFADKTGARRYAAYVLRKSEPNPLLVPICSESFIDSLLNVEDGVIHRLCSGSTAVSLAKACIAPLLPYFRKGETVYYVPSGIFHQIPFDALPLEDGVLVGDKFKMVCLTSAREICQKREPAPSNPSATLYGGLVYDMNADEMALESHKYKVSSIFALPGFRNGNGRTFNYLPLSRKEVLDIKHTIQKRVKVNLLTGKMGTEESFLAMDGKSPDIIHLATHGFYYSANDSNKVSALSGYTDAMCLTGLVMSGGNAEWTGTKLERGVLGGLLTAEDIAKLDLSHTKLVCLSACNSGKGVITSEGVYGLQRAFKKAGVKTIIMSLWEASDASASLFMAEFYKKLTKTSGNLQKSFKYARNQVRKTYPEPFYWAGFVMIE